MSQVLMWWLIRKCHPFYMKVACQSFSFGDSTLAVDLQFEEGWGGEVSSWDLTHLPHKSEIALFIATDRGFYWHPTGTARGWSAWSFCILHTYCSLTEAMQSTAWHGISQKLKKRTSLHTWKVECLHSGYTFSLKSYWLLIENTSNNIS